MAEFVLSEESADVQMRILCEYYDFDLDDLASTEVRDTFKVIMRRLHKAIRRGHLEISAAENGGLDIVQHLVSPPGEITDLKYETVTGRLKMVVDRAGANNYERIYALIGSMTGIGKNAIQQLRGADLSICENLGAFFLTA